MVEVASQGRRLLQGQDPAAALLHSRAGAVSVDEFLGQAVALARALPPASGYVNLCDRRDLFLVAWCAVVLRGGTNLLPPSRAPRVVAEVCRAWPESHLIDDEAVLRVLARSCEPVPPDALEPISADHVVQIAFTSGSTGEPKGFAKRWGGLWGSSAWNARRIRGALDAQLAARSPLPRLEAAPAARLGIVATVPPQHMWGSETTVLLPLLDGMSVHTGRPLFPADVAAALAEVPQPRVLVSTPAHLRTLVASGVSMPPVEVVVSATAPMDAALAEGVEQGWGAVMLEMFGSTETCVFASRFTAREQSWWLYGDVRVEPYTDHALVSAPWFERPMPLQDVVEIEPDGRMLILGRNADLIEIAGKRASLADLTRRLLAVPGVEDAVVFQPTAAEAALSGVTGVQRVAALVVAPGLNESQIADQLIAGIDPLFMPRPLVLVAKLPRNAVGKLERKALLRVVFESRGYACDKDQTHG